MSILRRSSGQEGPGCGSFAVLPPLWEAEAAASASEKGAGAKCPEIAAARTESSKIRYGSNMEEGASKLGRDAAIPNKP